MTTEIQVDPTLEDQTPPATNEEMVSKSELKKALDDMMKFKKQAQEFQNQAKSYEQKVKEAEERQLEEKQEYKTLYEQTKQKLEEEKQTGHKLRSAFESDKKFEVLKRAAVKAGLRDESLDDLEYLDTSAVIVEKTDQGRMNIIGAEEFVDGLKERKPFWFKDSKAPNLNTTDGSPGAGPKELSAQQILKLQKDNPEKYRQIMAKRLKGA